MDRYKEKYIRDRMFACCAMAQVCAQLGGDMQPEARKYAGAALELYNKLRAHTPEDEELLLTARAYLSKD